VTGNGASPLRAALDATMAEHGGTLADLTVLDKANDPFRVDTPARHRDGQWLADTARELGLGDRRIHLRGLHYMLIGRPKPDGTAYANTAKDWEWLVEDAGKAARWLGYIPFDQIADQRNATPDVQIFTPPRPWPFISVGLDVDIPHPGDIEPRAGVADFRGTQPYKLVLFGEKSSLAEVLTPVAAEHHADLYLPTGEISDTLMYQMAVTGAEDGRPMVVLCFSDADPAGWQMPISISRKLQAFKALGTMQVRREDAWGHRYPAAVDTGALDFQVHRVALTPSQVHEHGLPSTPLKDSEARAGKWRAAMGVEQTEIDALASLQPGLLRTLARQAIAPFYDHTLRARVARAESQWEHEADQVIASRLDPGVLGRIRDQAAHRLAELRVEIDALNDQLRVDPGDFDLPEIVIPEAELDGMANPLIDSRWGFADQCRRLIDSKAYRQTGAEEAA
jgi:hypothetical protein